MTKCLQNGAGAFGSLEPESALFVHPFACRYTEGRSKIIRHAPRSRRPRCSKNTRKMLAGRSFTRGRRRASSALLGLRANNFCSACWRQIKSIFGRYLGGRTSATEIREAIVQATEVRPPTPSSMDLPLSDECKRILKFSAEESTSSERQHVDTEDLLLGILREEDSFAARLLVDRGLDLKQARRIAKGIKPQPHD
jgi:hypothetical protein